MGWSVSIKDSNNFVENLAFNISTLFPTSINKRVLLNEKKMNIERDGQLHDLVQEHGTIVLA